MKMTMSRSCALTVATLIALGTARVAWADTVVQIPIDSLLDARPVSTVTNGVEVPWTAGQGIDGNGGGDGYVTQSVAAKHNYTGPALPNDGIFPAANGLPEFDLHFADADPATSFQAHNAHAGMAATIQFAVPQATYSNLHLVMTDSENADTLTVTLTYSDATTSTVGPFTMPDYDQGLPGNTKDVSYFSIFSGQKWGPTDSPGDNMGHSITGVTLTPSPTKPLTGVTINKPSDGHYLVFWGAVGIATSPVDAGAINQVDGGAMVGQSGASTGTSSGAASGTVTATGTGSGTTAESGAAAAGGAASGTATSSGDVGSGSIASGGTSSGARASSGGGALSGSIAASGASPQSGTSASGPSKTSGGGGCSVPNRGPADKGASSLVLLLLCIGRLLRRRTHRGSVRGMLDATTGPGLGR
jgi:hypothetical protein